VASTGQRSSSPNVLGVSGFNALIRAINSFCCFGSKILFHKEGPFVLGIEYKKLIGKIPFVNIAPKLRGDNF